MVEFERDWMRLRFLLGMGESARFRRGLGRDLVRLLGPALALSSCRFGASHDALDFNSPGIVPISTNDFAILLRCDWRDSSGLESRGAGRTRRKLFTFRLSFSAKSWQVELGFDGGYAATMRLDNPDTGGSGSGRDLPLTVLTVATLSALLATALSLWTVTLQLKNYRKIGLQRFTVRILVMRVISPSFPPFLNLPR